MLAQARLDDLLDQAVNFFGRGGLAMIPFLNKGSGFMTKFAQEAKTFGYIMDKDARKKSEEFLLPTNLEE